MNFKVNVNELNLILRNSKVNKAFALDTLLVSQILYLPEVGKQLVLRLFNDMNNENTPSWCSLVKMFMQQGRPG